MLFEAGHFPVHKVLRVIYHVEAATLDIGNLKLSVLWYCCIPVFGLGASTCQCGDILNKILVDIIFNITLSITCTFIAFTQFTSIAWCLGRGKILPLSLKWKQYNLFLSEWKI